MDTKRCSKKKRPRLCINKSLQFALLSLTNSLNHILCIKCRFLVAMGIPLMAVLLFSAEIDFHMSKNMRYGRLHISFDIDGIHNLNCLCLRLSLIKLHNL